MFINLLWGRKSYSPEILDLIASDGQFGLQTFNAAAAAVGSGHGADK